MSQTRSEPGSFEQSDETILEVDRATPKAQDL
jgi:hypothetical protein